MTKPKSRSMYTNYMEAQAEKKELEVKNVDVEKGEITLGSVSSSESRGPELEVHIEEIKEVSPTDFTAYGINQMFVVPANADNYKFYQMMKASEAIKDLAIELTAICPQNMHLRMVFLELELVFEGCKRSIIEVP